MAETIEQTRRALREYILDEFLPGEKPEALTDDTTLISAGVLDSIATLKLVSFLEKRYGIELEAHEMGIDFLDTLEQIAALVREKLDAAT